MATVHETKTSYIEKQAQEVTLVSEVNSYSKALEGYRPEITKKY